jgi:hypothetical protein
MDGDTSVPGMMNGAVGNPTLVGRIPHHVEVDGVPELRTSTGVRPEAHAAAGPPQPQSHKCHRQKVHPWHPVSGLALLTALALVAQADLMCLSCQWIFGTDGDPHIQQTLACHYCLLTVGEQAHPLLQQSSKRIPIWLDINPHLPI